MQSPPKPSPETDLQSTGGRGESKPIDIDMTGVAAVLLRNGAGSDEVGWQLEMSAVDVEKASRHCLNDDKVIAAVLETVLMRLATGYFTKKHVGAAGRDGGKYINVYHRPDMAALRLLIAVTAHKRYGEALGQDVKPDKLVNLGIAINLGDGSKAKDVTIAEIIPANKAGGQGDGGTNAVQTT